MATRVSPCASPRWKHSCDWGLKSVVLSTTGRLAWAVLSTINFLPPRTADVLHVVLDFRKT
jgi:hypothetical protein